ncbi:B3 domain-containing transcription factor VRN1-like [Tripterygium wilfordii]|uniref:B3 domain-containing transcription factor VRN1-like n=1 Tax=Tripterygium wilfordii TaxID=458696 RepID=UPI0018F82763|nr:B3 domain-containing transcription factor VRN1-like [Tripterygium wilfordii]XP_038723750.1 B3 domain-containing transcription factor VRN1-like [Tripterygium wilfordii]XP_038723751.1 B3 domain-containing transcription factor VRN1-like [Tripterygium wilfordii]XP_038723752.1 B3 domain-containing transcription factor VRN1-like [Tripterygium wilfordii]XP_038723753.1 B3 domain-containing transcription factor VRN1-like [Tripterygium wilfordii]XP_038723754.1 B3 domain-containing transcription facto
MTSTDVLSCFVPKRPHFFKIILEQTIQEGKLELPRNFVKEYGSAIPKSVSVRVPSGAVWQVELSRYNDNVWLEHGWREFAEYYSMEYGHLLVFEHEGCSRFNVVIFDKSATEINYTHYSSEDHASIEMLDEFTVSPRARKRSPLHVPHPHKKMRKWPLTSEKIAETLQRATSENPYFKVVMTQTSVRKGYGLRIPMAFARRYLRENQSDVTLCVSTGRTWSTEYHHHKERSDQRTLLYRGWHEFVHDNNLKVGDVCVFELINISEVRFKVFIFQVNEDPNMHGDPKMHLSLGHGSGPSGVEPKRTREKFFVSDCACKKEVLCLNCLSNWQAKKVKQELDCIENICHQDC